MISVGLTISKDKIKIVQLKGTYKRLKLIKTYTLDASTSSSDIALSIKKFLKKNNIKTKYICLNLPRRQILASIIELPAIKKELINQALKYEVEEHIPYPIEEVYYDYQVLGEHDKKTNILLVAVRKEIVNSYLQLLSQANLSPLVVDVDSFGVVNLCLELFAKEFKQQTVLLISGGADCREISLFKNERLQFTKSLPIILDEATLLEEIKKIIDYFQTQFDEFRIDKIILTEGISTKLVDRIKVELKIPAININPITSLTSIKKSLDFDELTTVSSAFRGIKEGKLKVDLSPMKEIRAKEIRKKNYIRTGILCAIIIILLSGIFHINIITKERKLYTLKTIIQKNQPVVNEIIRQKEQLLALQEEFNILQNTNENKIEFLDLLLELSTILPSNVWIKSITFEGDQLKELRGCTLGSASLLLPILENSPYFKEVEFTGSIVKHKVKNQEIEEFSLKATINKK
jgi:Tfp pilus assembly PilM family ATPase/Tfp pilus assembly protein PilN